MRIVRDELIWYRSLNDLILVNCWIFEEQKKKKRKKREKEKEKWSKRKRKREKKEKKKKSYRFWEIGVIFGVFRKTQNK